MDPATPPHPLTGGTVLRLDPLDWIHAICQQIPDRGQHLTRYYGAYANRNRKVITKRVDHVPSILYREKHRQKLHRIHFQPRQLGTPDPKSEKDKR